MSVLNKDVTPESDLLSIALMSNMLEDELIKEVKEEVKDHHDDFYGHFDEICPNLREWSMHPISSSDGVEVCDC